MNTKRLYNIVLVLVFLSGIGILSGCGYRSPEKRAEWITEKIASKLELSEVQKKELNAFREELINQLGHETIDQKYLKEVIRKEETRLDETISLFVERLAGFHASLTPEQREKLTEMVRKWKGHKNKYCRYKEK